MNASANKASNDSANNSAGPTCLPELLATERDLRQYRRQLVKWIEQDETALELLANVGYLGHPPKVCLDFLYLRIEDIQRLSNVYYSRTKQAWRCTHREAKIKYDAIGIIWALHRDGSLEALNQADCFVVAGREYDHSPLPSERVFVKCERQEEG